MHLSTSRGAIALWVLGILAAGCSGQSRTEAPPAGAGTTTAPTTTAAPPAAGKLLLIHDMPHVTQKTDFCGEACAEMVLRKLGKKITQDEVFNASGLSPMLGRGCYTGDLHKALRKIGFSVGSVFYYVQAAGADKGMKRQFDAVLADLKRGIPSIVCMHYDSKPVTTEHMRLVVGFDGKKGEVIYHEPASANGAYLQMSLKKFLALWPLK